MSAVEARSSDAVEGLSGRGSRAPRRWRLALTFAVVILLVAAAGVFAYQWRASFQPLGYGGTGYTNEYYPGLPTGAGIRAVNTFGYVREDIYIPPQRGTFSLFVDLSSNGSRAVTIESVTLPPGGPLTAAGPVVYSRPGGGDGQPAVPLKHLVLRDVRLDPGQDIYIGIPVRTWPCAVQHSWVAVPSFYVTYRYSIFKHTVAVAWGGKDDELIMGSPAGRPGQHGIVCAGH